MRLALRTVVLEEKLSHSKHTRESLSLSLIQLRAPWNKTWKPSADLASILAKNVISRPISWPRRRNFSSKWELKNATVHIILRSRKLPGPSSLRYLSTAANNFQATSPTTDPDAVHPIASPSYLCLASASPLPAPHCYQFA